MRKTASIFFLLLTLTGCVTAYQLSENATALSSSLDQQAAINLVGRLIAASDSQMGVCTNDYIQGVVTSTGMIDAKSIALQGTVIRYQGEIKRPVSTSVSGNFMAGTGQVAIKYSIDKVIYGLDVAKLEKILIHGVAERGPCSQFQHGKIIGMVGKDTGVTAASNAHTIVVHVAPENIDQLLAALKRLSPKVIMRESTVQ